MSPVLRASLLLLATLAAVAALAVEPPRGWRLTLESANGERLEDRAGVDPPAGQSLEAAGALAPAPARLRYAGLLRVPRSSTYLFGVRGPGESRLVVDSVEPRGMSAAEVEAEGWSSFGYCELEAGLVPLELELREPALGPWSVEWSQGSTWLHPIARSEAYPSGGAATRLAFRQAALALASLALLAWIGCFLPARHRRRLALLVLGAVLVVALAETGLRALGIRPRPRIPISIWLEYDDFPAGSSTRFVGTEVSAVQEFTTEVAMNTRGWREREFELAKPKGVKRLLVLGDSFVEGKEVAFEHTFHELVERELALVATRENLPEALPSERWEVIALARGGSGTLTELGFLEETGLSLAPDAILVAFYPGNDVCDNSPTLFEELQAWQRDIQRGVVTTARLRCLQSELPGVGSRLMEVLADHLCEVYVDHLDLFRSDLDAAPLVSPTLGLYANPLAPRWEEAWQASERALERMAQCAARTRTRFAVLAVADAKSSTPAGDPAADRPYARLAAICERLEIEWIDPRPLFRDAVASGLAPCFRFDHHWNELGHQLAATAVLAWLEGK